ncbi:dihydrofolate reductase [Aurantibacter crassamenti]|uniref:dihydrofolate reductase family protein n=1 Tax=Aurantibacter crassamenti TaxID=1837375 RepID=UPI001939FF39|nr:dihydrofolate reductase family protein [Aurantibacter crassamenti]MBM1105985.1 dihydrofolate reductase [Aurantibacter crassamenti]
MKKIIYYVAISIDGFIAGPNEDISGFTAAGEGVNKYLEDLKDFKTVIMGRKTYEFGYKYGLVPGQPAYPHMQHYIFSFGLQFENQSDQVHVCKLDIDIIKNLKQKSETDIYMCGGGKFAGWLLENELIDIVKIKLNPLILGDGIRLFGSSKKQYQLKLVESESFNDGLTINTYQVNY